MYLKTVYARFYKSFNFDYLRKAHKDAKFDPWDSLDGQWFPYVKIPLEDTITAVVGANESGKSHLLSAIEKGLTGKNLAGRDVCRYSPFFNVERGKNYGPQIGLEWDKLTAEQSDLLAKILDIEVTTITRFLMFRVESRKLVIYLPNSSGTEDPYELESEQLEQLEEHLLMRSFRIKPEVALPNSIPISWLGKTDEHDEYDEGSRFMSRKKRMGIARNYSNLSVSMIESEQAVQQNSNAIYNNFFAPVTKLESEDLHEESLQLAKDLLLVVANIDPKKLNELYDAVENGHEGHADGLVDEINKQLDKKLNFRKWWVQDKNFSLRLSLRESDLVFIIRDRTGKDYTFSERSNGLKYFLSYYVQYKAHNRELGFQEILLMDEPDAYLSAEGQQDLLKIFNDCAEPENDLQKIQVVYVTHSPFLIDKNHSERIRVLSKGRDREGTNVISNAAQNHYEPLRSAFGSFVGEAAFIGNTNLILEGQADQVLLAGAANLIKKYTKYAEQETLDLNRVTLVPAGSAGHIPYVVYLARGRDELKPAVIVLLDSDDGGKNAFKILRRSKPSGTKMLDEKYIQLLGDIDGLNSDNIDYYETEDMIPLSLAVAAVNRYFQLLSEFSDSSVMKLEQEQVEKNIKNSKGLYDAIEKTLLEKDSDNIAHIEKVGFARAVLEIAEESLKSEEKNEDYEASISLLNNMKKLFVVLNTIKRMAEREVREETMSRKVDKLKDIFLIDHSSSATKEDVIIFIEELEEILDSSKESTSIRKVILEIKSEFSIEEEITEVIADYQNFKEKLETLKYASCLDSLEVDTNETNVLVENIESDIQEKSDAQVDTEVIID